MAKVVFEQKQFNDFMKYLKAFQNKPQRIRLFLVDDGAVILKRAVESDSIDTAVIMGLSAEQIANILKEYNYPDGILRVSQFIWDEDRK